MQLQVEKVIAKAPEVRTVFSRTGTADLASDPMPPNATDTFIMLKPRKEWPDPSLPKAELAERLERALDVMPGNEYEFSQTIQMRLNELIAGVKSDIAIKEFGEDFAAMDAPDDRMAAVRRPTRGAAEGK